MEANILFFFLSRPFFHTCFDLLRVVRGLAPVVWVFCFPQTVQNTNLVFSRLVKPRSEILGGPG